ncbi:MAG: amidohydrolase [Chloroflexi bacterium]|nr:amidohydrolase [Chloroflexota bacterium]
MASIDIHAHILPRHIAELANGGDWHGYTLRTGDSAGSVLTRQGKDAQVIPKLMFTPEQRLAEMDSLGVDVHVLSTWTRLYNYDLPTSDCLAIARDCNDSLGELVKQWPTRFMGIGTLPMQDVNAAIAELERCMTQLGLKGAQINDHVNGSPMGEDEFLPFWKAVEEMGAVILFHQSEGDTVVQYRSNNYHLNNTIGNLADRTVTYASLVYGGVMDKHPDLKICLSHGGGYTAFGAGRLDRGWQVRSEARITLNQPPSRYLSDFYYDCLTHSEDALRFLIDTVGVGQVVMGSDWPFDMGVDSPVEWLNGMSSLTQAEKDAIITTNLAELLGI